MRSLMMGLEPGSPCSTCRHLRPDGYTKPSARRVLEVGCGTGAILRELSDRQYPPHGLDLEPDSLTRHLIGGLTFSEAHVDWNAFKKISLHASALTDMNTFLLPPLLLALALLFLVPLWRSVRAVGFEKRRWEESDHPWSGE